mmetsp:Transcript_3229/g.3501  ORF Transcript_3229/g.3501 Transcript_3229/m.3501 type:complete len:244 (-) Transcript_3229:217-948(-)|eukprot:CAMPEP_0115028100 /NCGR_PEP_ID=MMETSP0216-20121206/36022_1 /TAXON_ID=223996 /ORGANISM="Protocruzia adherens, Strain Boccale" /LENGTH=243 /DNA_ID=CAMNT_0002404065 /DNA_START=33 /DNA_END=764 /DNA_ORIENTATION=+
MRSLLAAITLILIYLLSTTNISSEFLGHSKTNTLSLTGYNGVVDISSWQGTNLDFNTAYSSAGIRGVIHKATQGTTYTDGAYQTNKRNAKAAGMLWGAYHFATGSTATAQAEHFLSVVNPDSETLLVLDFERNPSGSSMSIDQAVEWVDYVKDRHGKYPVVYGGGYLKDMLGGTANPTLSQCPLWIAEYGSSVQLPPGWGYYSLWQYTDGQVGPGPHNTPGLGNVDKDIWNGSEESLRRFWTS